MKNKHEITVNPLEKRFLLSYLTPEEKHKLVGSFVVENFWDTFINLNIDSINRFRAIAKARLLNIDGFIKRNKKISYLSMPTCSWFRWKNTL
jgi:hypothetical protein